MIIRTIFIFILAFATQLSFAMNTKQEQLVALDTMIAELKTHYGMAKYKVKMFGSELELTNLRNKYANLINEATTLEESLGMDPKIQRDVLPPSEAQQLLIGLISELRDGHVNVGRQTDSVMTLGLFAVPIGEKLIVTMVRKDLVAPNASAKEIAPQDEVVAIDGVPVLEVVKRNMLYMMGGTFDDRFHSAMSYTLTNPNIFLRPKKEGELVRVKIRRKDEEFTANLRWIERSDYTFMTKRFPTIHVDPLEKAIMEDVPVPYGARGTVHTYFKSGLLKHEAGETLVDIGAELNAAITKAQEKAKANPNDPTAAALKDMTPVTRLQVYMVRHKDKNVGVLRIPSYNPPTGMAGIKAEYQWAAMALKKLEKLSDVLVIDQLSNTGGAVYHTIKLMSLFANGDSLRTVANDTRLNATLLHANRPQVENDPITGQPPNYAELTLEKKYYEELKAMYERGEEWTGLRASFHLSVSGNEDGPGMIFTSKDGVYTKPILILNDRMSGSGGDFFPAQMQENKRAIIMGETSCGLGGPVYRKTDSMPGSELSFRCTSAYSELANGWPIENIGAIPDIARPITMADLGGGFKDYANDALNEAVKLAGVKVEAAPVKPAKRPTPIAKAVKALEGAKTDAAYLASLQKLVELYKPEQKKDWSELVIGLPESLREDLILRTIYRRLEVVARLKEMRNLPRWQNNESLALIDALVEAGEKIDTDIQFADPCSLILAVTPLK